MNNFALYFHDFNYRADEIKKYHEAAGIFTMLLKNGDIIHFQPANKDKFKQWLNENGVQDLREEEI